MEITYLGFAKFVKKTYNCKLSCDKMIDFTVFKNIKDQKRAFTPIIAKHLLTRFFNLFKYLIFLS